MQRNQGFTLVELAIVITIIGLLIGGVLKGQELLDNARMTSLHKDLQAYNAGVVTFRDIYKALPGDIRTPANFIQNCTTSPCNMSGDANGIIGPDTSFGDENNTFWLHLSRAGLVSGINPNATWTTDFFATTASPPSTPFGGRMGVVYLGLTWSTTPTQRIQTPTHYWHTAYTPLEASGIAKYDLKFDDGRPLTGTVILHPGCALAADNLSYDPNLKTKCNFIVKSEF